MAADHSASEHRLAYVTGLPWAWDRRRWAYTTPSGWELVELTDYSHELRHMWAPFTPRRFTTDTRAGEVVMLATVAQAVGGGL